MSDPAPDPGAAAARPADAQAARGAAEAARRLAEANDRRYEFLSHASRQLGRSFDAEVGLRQLTDLALRAGARVASVALVDDALVPQRACRVTAHAGGRAQTVNWIDAAALPPAELEALRQAVHDRRTLALPGLLAVPLVAGQRVQGALVVVDAASVDATLFEELATRAAFALANARLYRSLQRQIEERTVIERELQSADRRKDDFVATLSHELRNPLSAAVSALELLDAALPGDGAARSAKAKAILRRQLDQLTRLIDELLDVARIGRHKIVLVREPVAFNTMVVNGIESLQPMLSLRHQHVALTLPDAAAWIDGDPARLTQIVSNLVHNASKYSPAGQSIEVDCSVDAGSAQIRVRDHGIGIDAQMLPRMFELFEHGDGGLDRAQSGLGVGLTLALRLAQLHGGQLEASSEGPGRGAEFRVRLPCLQGGDDEHDLDQDSQGPDTRPPVPVRDPALMAPRRILIIDDNVDAGEGLQQLMQLAGHEVQVVRDGHAGLAAACRMQPDAMLIDIGLPLIDGLELARRLRAMPAFERTLLIALTGYGQVEDRAAALGAGFDHHFVKPAQTETLLQVIGASAPA